MGKKNTLNPSSDSITVLSGLAHELKAPLQSLIVSSQKLLDTYQHKHFEYISYKDFKHIMSTLELINTKIKRCHEITRHMSGLDRTRATSESSDINETISEILGLLRQQLTASKIKVRCSYAKKLPFVALSKVDGHQVIHNILTNAIQAMPAGGGVNIRTYYDAKLKLATVVIADQGVGISSTHLPKVFEPFFTTKEQGVEKSFGLGLSIVYAIVQAAGGSIHIQSSLRHGTQVKVSLPVVL